MKQPVDQAAINQLFTHARSYNRWHSTAVDENKLRLIYDLAKLGPTSANCCPARFIFVCSHSAKSRLVRCMSKNNQAKVEQAAASVIIGWEERFFEKIGYLFPHSPQAALWFADPEVASLTALRNSSLQGAYFMLAARALGFDCGPMSGFDNEKVDAEFFSGTTIKSNFICALGHGISEGLHRRLPRFSFDEVCAIE